MAADGSNYLLKPSNKEPKDYTLMGSSPSLSRSTASFLSPFFGSGFEVSTHPSPASFSRSSPCSY